ncbi:hypothetical protein D3C71_1545780 [compost metagenome]
MLFHAHVQLAADSVVQVLNAERARRHLRVVKHAAQLPHDDARIAAGHAGYFGRIATQVWRQHAVVAGQAGARIAEAAEQIRVQVVFAHDQA